RYGGGGYLRVKLRRPRSTPPSLPIGIFFVIGASSSTTPFHAPASPALTSTIPINLYSSILHLDTIAFTATKSSLPPPYWKVSQDTDFCKVWLC
ncbi:hypothetical protein B0H19DRAFT_1386011, partial [Mycena capillaripes]